MKMDINKDFAKKYFKIEETPTKKEKAGFLEIGKSILKVGVGVAIANILLEAYVKTANKTVDEIVDTVTKIKTRF